MTAVDPEIDHSIRLGRSRVMVQTLIRNVLYPVDMTEEFTVEHISQWENDKGEYLHILTSSLPDDMFYMVTWPPTNEEPTIQVLKDNPEISGIRSRRNF